MTAACLCPLPSRPIRLRPPARHLGCFQTLTLAFLLGFSFFNIMRFSGWCWGTELLLSHDTSGGGLFAAVAPHPPQPAGTML